VRLRLLERVQRLADPLALATERAICLQRLIQVLPTVSSVARAYRVDLHLDPVELAQHLAVGVDQRRDRLVKRHLREIRRHRGEHGRQLLHHAGDLRKPRSARPPHLAAAGDGRAADFDLPRFQRR
jgi:hypothetical protein